MMKLPEELFIQQVGLNPSEFVVTDQEQNYYINIIQQGLPHERYIFQNIVNIGGTGIVLRVLDQELRRPLAMKLLLPPRKHTRQTIASFVKEAKIHGWLEHPNIIPLHEFGCLQETGLFFTMSLVLGETLRDFLLKVKRRDTEALQIATPYWLLNVFRKVCDAISYAHSMGILHQDLKPDNIIIGPYGEVFVLDWGAAKIIGDPATETDPLKQQFWQHMLGDADLVSSEDGRLQGTPSFMSPEQAKGEHQHLDERSDIFLLGATLYTIFTLKLPYIGSTLKDVLHQARHHILQPPHVRSPEQQIPEEICRIMMKAMSVKPEERYQTVEELTQDLDEMLAGRWLQHDTRNFQTDETLMREGDDGHEAYLLLKGNVLVTKQRDDTHVVLGVSQRGDIVGEMALISEEPRSATVQALEETSVAVLTKEMLNQHLKRLPPYIADILTVLTHRLQSTDSMIHPYITSDCSAIVLKQLRLIFKDRFGDQLQDAQLSLDEVVEEISHDLGISASKVSNVLFATHHLALLRITPENSLQIPDIQKLADYTQHVHLQNGDEDSETAFLLCADPKNR